MITADITTAAPAIAALLAQARQILLITHVNPDGDAIGSLLGVWHSLRASGKTAVALAPSALPEYVCCLPGIEHVQVYQAGQELPTCDLIWMMDTAALDRAGPVYEEHATQIHQLPIIVVDHHITNPGEGRINLIDAHAASTAELLTLLLTAMHAPLPPEAATALLLGITTDTQSFQTSSSGAQALRAAALLLEAGADQQAIVRKLYYALPFGTAQLVGKSFNEIRREGGLIWTHVSQEMRESSEDSEDASDYITQMLQRIDGMQVAVLFKERPDGTVKISLRSIPDIDVAEIATLWGGGGHAQAAGATLPLGLQAAEATVLSVVREAIRQAG